ncbi:MAG: PIG-L deacetylase family protein [Eubacterium sp.]
MKILIIAAHPDDEVYGMGGTIAKLNRAGNEIYVLIVTEGCSTQYVGNKDIILKKQKEAQIAGEILGIKAVMFSNLPDMKLDTVSHVAVNQVIEDAIRKIKPAIVYTHHRGDVNKDHRIVYESTMVAVRPIYTQCVKKILCYAVPSSSEWNADLVETTFHPTVFEEIDPFYGLKQRAIESYGTEIRAFPHPRSLKYVDIFDRAMGLKVGLKRSEGFQLIREISGE